MSDQLNRLIASAKAIKMTEAQQEEQRRSFAYGNGKLSNQRVSRDSVNDEANRLAGHSANGKGCQSRKR